MADSIARTDDLPPSHGNAADAPFATDAQIPPVLLVNPEYVGNGASDMDPSGEKDKDETRVKHQTEPPEVDDPIIADGDENKRGNSEMMPLEPVVTTPQPAAKGENPSDEELSASETVEAPEDEKNMGGNPPSEKISQDDDDTGVATTTTSVSDEDETDEHEGEFPADEEKPEAREKEGSPSDDSDNDSPLVDADTIPEPTASDGDDSADAEKPITPSYNEEKTVAQVTFVSPIDEGTTDSPMEIDACDEISTVEKGKDDTPSNKTDSGFEEESENLGQYSATQEALVDDSVEEGGSENEQEEGNTAAAPEKEDQPTLEEMASETIADSEAEEDSEAEVPEETQEAQEDQDEKLAMDVAASEAEATTEEEAAPNDNPGDETPEALIVSGQRPGLAEAHSQEVDRLLANKEKNTDTASDSTDKASNTAAETEEPRPSPKPAPAPLTIITPRSDGISFAEAFGSAQSKKRIITPRRTPSHSIVPPLRRSNSDGSETTATTTTPLAMPELKHTAASHSALSASRNRRASGLISKYQEKVAHEALPGDSVPIKSSSNHSRRSFEDNYSPATEKSIVRDRIAVSTVELEHLPDMNSVRAKFEKTSRRSTKNFEFGESFRQKKRHEQLSEKEQKEEAKVAIRGFNEKVLNQGKTASGEIDTSNLPKSFTFEMCSSAAIVPNDGVCRVDYKTADFFAKVFVVHRTRGMLILRSKIPSPSKKSRKTKIVPGGKISEVEFLSAAEQSGSASVQLQIAAREAVARQLYEATGLDVREEVERFKPAVLNSDPPINNARGFQYLRNEKDNKLYYFLQVDDADFEKLKEAQVEIRATEHQVSRPSEDSGEGSEATIAKQTMKQPSEDSWEGSEATITKQTMKRPSEDSWEGSEATIAKQTMKQPSEDSGEGSEATITKQTMKRPSEDSGEGSEAIITKQTTKRPSEDAGDEPLELRLSDGYVGFEFVQDPVIASKVLKKEKSDESTALSMIMNSAAQEIRQTNLETSSEDKQGPDAKATVHERKSILDDDDSNEQISNSGNIRTIELKKAETDAIETNDTTKDDAAAQKEIIETSVVAGKSAEKKAESTFYSDEAKLKMKTSNDTAEEMAGVSCCCSLWW